MRRRLGLAQALLGDPELVVLDEPTVGLDPEQRLRFRDLVSRTGEDRTVVLSTHQVEDVAALCEHVVVVDRGRTLFAGSVPQLVATAERSVLARRPAGPGCAARLAPRHRGVPPHRHRLRLVRTCAAQPRGRLPAAARRPREGRRCRHDRRGVDGPARAGARGPPAARAGRPGLAGGLAHRAAPRSRWPASC
jgi:ABC-type antimicrobial peptide transport system ATPase subunit